MAEHFRKINETDDTEEALCIIYESENYTASIGYLDDYKRDKERNVFNPTAIGLFVTAKDSFKRLSGGFVPTYDIHEDDYAPKDSHLIPRRITSGNIKETMRLHEELFEVMEQVRTEYLYPMFPEDAVYKSPE